VAERKIPEVSTVFTELLCSMRVGAQKLLVVPSNSDWLNELDESHQNKSFLVLFVELVDVSKKRQLKKKKSKSKAEANDNDEAEDEEPATEPVTESTAIVPVAAVAAVPRPVETPSSKAEAASSSEPKRTTYEPQAANLAEIADVISQARTEMSNAANKCSAHSAMLEKRCLQSFKVSLSGLYNQVGAQLVAATGAGIGCILVVYLPSPCFYAFESLQNRSSLPNSTSRCWKRRHRWIPKWRWAPSKVQFVQQWQCMWNR
jgi:hypothetical protein